MTPYSSEGTEIKGRVQPTVESIKPMNRIWLSHRKRRRRDKWHRCVPPVSPVFIYTLKDSLKDVTP